MKFRKKKLFAWFMVLCLCLNIVQGTVYAQGETGNTEEIQTSMESENLTVSESEQEEQEKLAEEEAESVTEKEAEPAAEEKTESSAEEKTESAAEEEAESAAEEEAESAAEEAESATEEEAESVTEEEAESVTEEETAHEHNFYGDYFIWSDDCESCELVLACDECAETPKINCVVTLESETVYNRIYKAVVEYNGKTYWSEREKPMGVNSGFMWYRYTLDGMMDIRGYSNGDLIQTSFADRGYFTVVECDGNQETIVFEDNGISAAHSSGLTVTPYITFSQNKKYAVVQLKVKNESDSQKTYSIGVNVDVDVDGDDFASIYKTNTGVKMINTDNDKVYYLACKNVQGLTNADSLWFGEYSSRWEHLFDTVASDSLTEVDSELTWGWTNRALRPGESVSYFYEIGIGAASEIDAPEEHYHSYKEEPENVEWAEDYSKCTATFVCEECNYKHTAECEVSETNTDSLYVAEVVFEGKTYTFEPEIVIDVLEDSVGAINQYGVHIIGSGDDLSLECSLPLEYFVSAEIDDILVDPSNYTLASGSTIITFSGSFLDTLTPGTHKVTLNYSINGRKCSVSTNIIIQNRKTEESKPTKPSESTNNNDRNTIIKAMTAYVFDVNGNPLKDYILEIHSKPVSAVLNNTGMASFSNLEVGKHTMYLKEKDGKVVASKEIVIAYAKSYSITGGNTINIIKGYPFTVNVKYDGKNLILMSVNGSGTSAGTGTSPSTGDQAFPVVWILFMMISAAGMVFVFTRKRKQMR